MRLRETLTEAVVELETLPLGDNDDDAVRVSVAVCVLLSESVNALSVASPERDSD